MNNLLFICIYFTVILASSIGIAQGLEPEPWDQLIDPALNQEIWDPVQGDPVSLNDYFEMWRNDPEAYSAPPENVTHDSMYLGSTTVGNGGDVFYCHTPKNPSAHSTMVGFYTLDYLLAAPDTELSRDLKSEFRTKNERFILGMLARPLLKAMPELVPNYNEFFFHVLNTDDFDAPYVWHPVDVPLMDIKDENIPEQFPTNCQPENGGKKYQAIIRKTPKLSGLNPNQIFYEYDPNVYKRLSSIQRSFLLLHEWLWNFDLTVDQVRNINRYVHSEQARIESSEVVREKLIALGLYLKGDYAEEYYSGSCGVHDSQELNRYNLLAYGHKAGFVTLKPEWHARIRLCNKNVGCRENWTSLKSSKDAVQNIIISSIDPIHSPTEWFGSGSIHIEMQPQFSPGGQSVTSSLKHFETNYSASCDYIVRQSRYKKSGESRDDLTTLNCKFEQGFAENLWNDLIGIKLDNMKWQYSDKNQCIRFSARKTIKIDETYFWDVQAVLQGNATAISTTAEISRHRKQTPENP